MAAQPLSYDTPRSPEPTAWLHHVAQVCGVAPLAFGTFVFLMFLATRDTVFIILGFWTIVAGLAAAFVGVVCAAVYLLQARRGAPEDHARARQAGFRDIAIIALNLPAAFVMAVIGVLLGW